MSKNTSILEEERECIGLCEKTKPLSEFAKDKWGYTYFCKTCDKEIDDKGLIDVLYVLNGNFYRNLIVLLSVKNVRPGLASTCLHLSTP